MTLPREFYDRPSATVARELLGKRLLRQTLEGLCGGRIVEVEAYEGLSDPASHSYRGLTQRNASMFGQPGHAYVYAIHSRWCLNAVTEPEGTPSAVLIRAIEPLVGLELMEHRRRASLLARRARLAARDEAHEKGSGVFGVTSFSILKNRRRQRLPTPLAGDPIPPRDLCRGPARLCEALAVTREEDGWNLTLGRDLWIEEDPKFNLPKRLIVRSPRIGISSATDRLLRFYLSDNAFVSGKKNWR